MLTKWRERENDWHMHMNLVYRTVCPLFFGGGDSWAYPPPPPPMFLQPGHNTPEDFYNMGTIKCHTFYCRLLKASWCICVWKFSMYPRQSSNTCQIKLAMPS